MPEPTGSDLHIDALLSNLSIAYMNEVSDYIADIVFPVVMSPKQSDKYANYNKYDWFRDEARLRAPLTESAGGGWELLEPGTFYCDDWSFHTMYSDDDQGNADDVFDLDDDATQFVTEKIRLSRERRWSTTYFGVGIWGKDLQGQTAAPTTDEFLCWDESGSTPIEDIEGAKSLVKGTTGIRPNTLVVADRTHQVLKNHSDVIDRYKYTQAGIITEALLARVFGIDRYLIGSAIYAEKPEDAESLKYILNEYGALLVYANPRPAKRRPSGGYTFRWNRPRWAGKTGERLAATIRKWHDKDKRGTKVEGSAYEDIQLIASDCGVYFSNAIADGRTITS